MSPGVHKLYWCQGDFAVTAIVKGELSPGTRTYLWASANPGCKLWYGDPRVFSRFKTKAWLLREEGHFLRPLFDGGTYVLIGFFTKWDRSSSLSPQRQIGTLFLTPAAKGDTLAEYAPNLWVVADIACDLLGKAECVRQIKALAQLGDPVLHEHACKYLKSEMDEDCRSK